MSTVDNHINAEDLQSDLSERGMLVHKGGAGHLDFQFIFMGYSFIARAETNDLGTRVNLRAMLGSLPYTSQNREGRAAAFKITGAASKETGQELKLTEDHRLILLNSRQNKEPITPVNLMTVITQFLLESKPYLEILGEYIKPPRLQEDVA